MKDILFVGYPLTEEEEKLKDVEDKLDKKPEWERVGFLHSILKLVVEKVPQGNSSDWQEQTTDNRQVESSNLSSPTNLDEKEAK